MNSREDKEVEPVQVFVRIRPDILQSSRGQSLSENWNPKCLFLVDNATIRVTMPDGAHSRKSVPAVDDKIFTYDSILSPEASQESVYDLVSHHVRATIQGSNSNYLSSHHQGTMPRSLLWDAPDLVKLSL
jgi:hypothetical protein